MQVTLQSQGREGEKRKEKKTPREANCERRKETPSDLKAGFDQSSPHDPAEGHQHSESTLSYMLLLALVRHTDAPWRRIRLLLLLFVRLLLPCALNN